MYLCCLPPIFNLLAILTRKIINKMFWPYKCAKSLANQQDSSLSLQILAALCQENEATPFLGTSMMESASSWFRLFILGESLQHFHLVSPLWVLPGLFPKQMNVFSFLCLISYLQLLHCFCYSGRCLLGQEWVSACETCNAFVSSWL